MLSSPQKSRLEVLFPAAILHLAVIVGAIWWLYVEYTDKQYSARSTLAAVASSAALRLSHLPTATVTDPTALADLKRTLDMARPKPDGAAWAIGDDGTVLEAVPEGLHPDTTPAMLDQLYRARIGGADYLAMETAVTGHPLRVVIAAPADDFFLDWWNEAATLALLLTVMLATSGYGVWRQLHLLTRLATANQTLEGEMRHKNAVLDAEIRERTQHESLARVLRSALEHAGSMVMITDAHGRIEYGNPAFFAATGFCPDDVIGRDPSFLRYRELSPPVPTLWPTITTGGTWTGYFCNRRHDGMPLWVSATISPIADESGRISHFVAVEEDATARHQAEEELRRAKGAAEAASLAKSEFLSSMSHELRTPLNAMMGFAQLLGTDTDRPQPERQKLYAQAILKSGEHLLSLVSDILDLARVEAGRLPLSFEPVLVEQTVAEILPMIEPMAARRRITLIDDVSGQGAPFVQADFTRLKQVLINLASNAVKYNRTGGSVRFGLDFAKDGPVRLTVADTGIGIPPQRQQDVFVPFTRLGAEASSIEGTGIGLTISKMLVEAMGGAIGFSSREGEGTTFWLDLKRADAPPPRAVAAEPGPATATVARQPQRILYVEDNPSNVELMEEVLSQDKSYPCELIVATSAEQGLDLARQNRPDLVVMDVNLPGISGIEAVARMKADPDLRTIPVLGLSADVMPETIRAGMKAGFLRYLRKPLDIAEFRKILYQLAAPKT